MGRSSERFGKDQDIQSKFIKQSAFHTTIEEDLIKYLALHSAKKYEGEGGGKGWFLLANVCNSNSWFF